MQRRQQRARVPGLPYPHPHLHKPALTSNDTSESTNVPHKCPKCGPKPGAFIYKYSMAEHFAVEHPSHEPPKELSEVSGAEKARLAKLWRKIEAKRPAKPCV